MAVVPINTPDEPSVELELDGLVIRDLKTQGPIFEVAKAYAEAEGDLVSMVEAALQIGGIALLQGKSRATIESVTDEIDRLIANTTTTTEKLPVEVEGKLKDNLEQLSNLLQEHFDPKRTTSVQSQITQMIDGSTTRRVKALTDELLDEKNGPFARIMNEKVLGEVKKIDRVVNAQLKQLHGTNQQLVTNVTQLVEKMEQKLQRDHATERSALKGGDGEEAVGQVLEALLSGLGDDVRHVGKEYGSDVKLKMAGDYVVTINQRHTGGKPVRFVVEVKTGRLSKPKAQQELDDAIRNRDAAAGVLVFDDIDDAPLGGRSYCPYPGGKFIAVYDLKSGDTLGFEVAVMQARLTALAAVQDTKAFDTAWLREQCDRLTEVLENAAAIRNGANYAQRGLDKIQASYGQLRSEAHSILSEIRSKISNASTT